MKEHLMIRHFGPVKDLDIDIKHITVFIGTQGCGKSTVSKIITIFRDMNLILQIYNQKEKIKSLFERFCIDEYFYADTYISYESMTGTDGFEIVYEKGEFNFYTYGISKDDFVNGIRKRIFEENKWMLSRLGVVDITDPDIEQKYGSLLTSNARTMLYVPAERNLVGMMSSSLATLLATNVPIYGALVEYMSIFEKAKNQYRHYNVPFLNSTYTVADGKERISFLDEITGENRVLPLQACSSGLQSVLPLVMVIDYALDTFFNSFVIEEPEQNLFPENQRALLSFLLERVPNVLNLIMTTHSPYILSCLNVAILAGKIQNKIAGQSKSVMDILHGQAAIALEYIAVYSLSPDSEEYCTSLISNKTGLISINRLDTVSENIDSDFDRLYSEYLKLLKK